ncbi:hypothetical protein [Candidatus Enterovibrio escicola]|uniref:hypothetical protein n=1 Tax=Candidatus Enterovibrio escicola TaxID=1927127 RepID=UPI0012383A3E|nr:hypothetical protein [Candidatus Enterovibrio escacola]
MSVLTNTYKVYNADTCKSVRINGYFIIKDLRNRGKSLSVLNFVLAQLRAYDRCYLSPFSIDRSE